jgi:acyl carrier protein
VSGAPPAAESVRASVAEFLARYVDDVSLLARDGLLTGGVLDSLAAVELIGHLERRFDLDVLDEDLEVENFDSLPAIVGFVGRKLRT